MPPVTSRTGNAVAGGPTVIAGIETGGASAWPMGASLRPGGGSATAAAVAGASAVKALVRWAGPSRSAFLRISWMRLIVIVLLQPLRGNPRNLAEHRHFEFVLEGARVVDRTVEELATERGGGAEHQAADQGERHDLQRLRLDRCLRQIGGVEHAEALAPLFAGHVFGDARVLVARIEVGVARLFEVVFAIERRQFLLDHRRGLDAVLVLADLTLGAGGRVLQLLDV